MRYRGKDFDEETMDFRAAGGLSPARHFLVASAIAAAVWFEATPVIGVGKL